MTSTQTGTARTDGTEVRTASGETDIREFGRELWSYLTGKGAVVEYAFEDMTVEVPKTTGADAPRATWRLNGVVRVRTDDRDSDGSVGSRTTA